MAFTNAPTSAGELFQWVVMLTLLGFVIQGPLNRARAALMDGIGGVKGWTLSMRERKVEDEDEPGRYLHYYVSSFALFFSVLAAVSVMLAVGRTLGLISPTFGLSRETMDSVIVIIVAAALVLGGAYGFYRFRWLGDHRNHVQESETRILDRGPDERHLALVTVAIAAAATLVGAVVRALALLTDVNGTLALGDGPVADTLDVLARIGVVIFWVVAELSFVSTGILAHPGLEFGAAQSLRFLGWFVYLVIAAILGLLALVIAILVYIPNRIGDGIRALWRALTGMAGPSRSGGTGSDERNIDEDQPEPAPTRTMPPVAASTTPLRPRAANVRGAEELGAGQDASDDVGPAEAPATAEDPIGRRANPSEPQP